MDRDFISPEGDPPERVEWQAEGVDFVRTGRGPYRWTAAVHGFLVGEGLTYTQWGAERQVMRLLDERARKVA